MTFATEEAGQIISRDASGHVLVSRERSLLALPLNPNPEIWPRFRMCGPDIIKTFALLVSKTVVSRISGINPGWSLSSL
jgi:hypothetical protein